MIINEGRTPMVCAGDQSEYGDNPPFMSSEERDLFMFENREKTAQLVRDVVKFGGGHDYVIGMPPWERIEKLKKEAN